MSLEKAKEYLENKGFLEHVIELKESTATVIEAANALGTSNDCKNNVFFAGREASSYSDRRYGKSR